MKKTSTSQSAFFNVRVLIGLFLALVGVSLLAITEFATAKIPGLGLAASSHARSIQAQKKPQIITRSQYISPLVPAGFDCSSIRKLGIDKMENFRAGAIMIFCGEAQGWRRTRSRWKCHCVLQACAKAYGASVLWGADVDLITGNRELSQYYSVRDVHYRQSR